MVKLPGRSTLLSPALIHLHRALKIQLWNLLSLRESRAFERPERARACSRPPRPLPRPTLPAAREGKVHENLRFVEQPKPDFLRSGGGRTRERPGGGIEIHCTPSPSLVLGFSRKREK